LSYPDLSLKSNGFYDASLAGFSGFFRESWLKVRNMQI
jgi:hypothetical protein